MRSFFASLSAFLKGVTCEHHDPISAHHDLVSSLVGIAHSEY